MPKPPHGSHRSVQIDSIQTGIASKATVNRALALSNGTV
ncbi:MAG: hypothetical protein RL490_156, partial [Pseudomonadota bacterium]